MTGVEELIRLPPYSLPEHKKEDLLLPVIIEGVKRSQYSRPMRNMFAKLGVDPSVICSLEDVPPLPVQMFKYFDLSTVPSAEVFRVLRSSGTTGQLQSMVPLDKVTSSNQTKALKVIMADFMGEKRMPFLVLDHPGVNDPTSELTARGAGVRGFSIFAKEVVYLLKVEDGQTKVDIETLAKAAERFAGQRVYLFGFTYIIWAVVVRELREAGLSFSFPNSVLFHGGGWKKLKDQKVNSREFASGVCETLGVPTANVHDFYGMAEQTGVIFVECEHGHKHVPIFAQVVIRDFQTLAPCPVGRRGLIEVMSSLGNSYYSQAILTEDVGRMLGVDDCPCGRKGRYFQVDGRMEQVEVRGCGDTFREGGK